MGKNQPPPSIPLPLGQYYIPAATLSVSSSSSWCVAVSSFVIHSKHPIRLQIQHHHHQQQQQQQQQHK